MERSEYRQDSNTKMMSKGEKVTSVRGRKSAKQRFNIRWCNLSLNIHASGPLHFLLSACNTQFIPLLHLVLCSAIILTESPFLISLSKTVPILFLHCLRLCFAFPHLDVLSITLSYVFVFCLSHNSLRAKSLLAHSCT